MLADERKEIILNEIDEHGKVKVVEMAEHLKVSNETIRRDIDSMVKSENIKRVHGGAIKTTYLEGEPPYQFRKDINIGAKEAIGRKAATLIEDGDIIFLDSGTTVQQMTRFIVRKKDLLFITNSLPTAMYLNDSIFQGVITGKVILLGGELSVEQKAVTGILCEKMLRELHVDKAFLSVGGITLQRGLSDYDLYESEISKIAASISKEAIVLADDSKVGVESFNFMIGLDEIDVVICNIKPPKTWKKELKNLGITWMPTTT